MALDPQVQTLLEQFEAMEAPPLEDQTPEEARQTIRALSALGSPAEVGRVADTVAPGPAGDVPVRVYVPATGDDGERFGVLVWYHGGGWVIGDLDTADNTCRALCSRGRFVVVSVGYRLAPEHPFPAGLEDAVAALNWTVASAGSFQGDHARVAVGGDSAGGNLAAVVARKAPDQDVELRFQLLVYPATDCRMVAESIEANGEGMLLTAEAMRWFTNHYIGDRDPADPDASPLLAEDLSGLAPALVITAEYDPLVDEGEAYAERLENAGVDVELVRFEGMIHGFFGLETVIDRAGEALDLAAQRVAKALAP